MKQLRWFFTSLTIFFLLMILPAWSAINVTVDGRPLTLAQPAIMANGRVMVPLRGVFESLGAQVTYDPAARSVLARRAGTRVALVVGSSTAFINGGSAQLDAPPIIAGDRIMVPLRFVSEAMGAVVNWTASNQTVKILSRTGGANLPLPPTGLIDSLAVSSPLISPGQTVTITMKGRPGGTAVMRVGGQNKIIMAETSPGIYTAIYTAPKGLAGSKLGVVAHLTLPNGVSDTSELSDALTVSAAAQPDLPSAQEVLPLSLYSPNPAATVPQVFDITGITKPFALVRLQITAVKSFIGMIFGSHKEQILSTSTLADSEGRYHFRADTGALAGGTHLVMTLNAENKAGAFSKELRIELTRG